MATGTPIEWTDITWNPIHGCSPVSEGCRNCYAARMSLRWSGPGQRHEGLAEMRNGRPVFTGKLLLHEGKLFEPFHWKRGRRIFVNSMADLFHEDVPFHFIDRVFATMAVSQQHTFQVLTKRPERMADYFRTDVFGRISALIDSDLRYTGCGRPVYSVPLRNVWLGTSVEDQHTLINRLPHLTDCPAVVRFVSCEPLIGKIPNMSWFLASLQWIIVGGESGPQARPCHVAWIRDLVGQCRRAGVPVFVKQLGAWVVDDGYPAYTCPQKWLLNDGSVWVPGVIGRADCERPAVAVAFQMSSAKGGDMAEWPEDLRVREYPQRG